MSNLISQIAWPSLGSALEMPWLALGPMHERIEKTILLPCMAPISSREAFIPGWESGCRLSVVTIASLLMGWCGLSREHVEDDTKSTCVKFGG